MAEDNGLDRLLQRMRSDLMYELRNIQHGERPVTGQNHRENIEKFVSKHFPGTDGESKNVPLSLEDQEDLRPESVVVEVQGIIEQKPVSSILQSAAFRRQLENVIRGSISSTRSVPASRRSTPRREDQSEAGARGRNSPINRRPPPRRFNPVEDIPVVRPRTSVFNRPGPSNVSASLPSRIPPSPPLLVRQDSSDSISSIDSFSSARSSQHLDDEDFELDIPSTTNEETSLPSLPTLPMGQAERQPFLHYSHRTRNDGVGSNGSLRYDDITRQHQEELVEEISELLHSQLVSQTLDSQFRATLEMHVQGHLEAAGGNGQAVRNFIRSLPASGIPRNDFTDLGIPPVNNDLDNLETLSVTNASAHSVPYTQTNTYLNKEIRGLKSQMTEMKNMLKLTFDLQMDIQRAIRQEVAAAMTQFAAQGAPPPPTKPVNDTTCLICLEHPSDAVLYQCGHMCVCYMCGRDLISRNLGCPVCRAPIKDVIRAYKTNAD